MTKSSKKKSESARLSRLQSYFPALEIPGVEVLLDLALDLRWSWNHRMDVVWRQLYPALWDRTRNPWVVLQTVSPEKLKRLLTNRSFRSIVDELVKERQQDAGATTWFQKAHPNAPLNCVGYFSMEYMLSEALPIYSGGLGNVAGDLLKTASDLGVPIIAVGLLYQRGYFRQIIDKNGMQQALFPYNYPGQLPITPLRSPDGEWIQVEVRLPGASVTLRAWQAVVGRVRLLLLDSNDPMNFPEHRGITSELYGGEAELRLKQEIVLGIGGWRVLEAIGLKPQVCHLNEGHTALVVLERAHSLMRERGFNFETAMTVARAGNLFTTHTAIPAAFDRFSPILIEQYLGRYAQEELGITLQKLLALGRSNPGDSQESFNMANLAIRGSGAVNAVSELHATVSREIFAPLFPRWPKAEVPIGRVTNGVHMPSWDSSPSDTLWTEACCKDRWRCETESLGEKISRIPLPRLWKVRSESRKLLVDYARAKLARQLEARGAPLEEIAHAKHIFDPHTLTLGVARRFAAYKRPNLLLHDPERLLRILAHPEKPVQLLIAGKAHPADESGKALIQQWIQFIQKAAVRPHVIFLSDYDLGVTEQLVQGVDLWINTPRRPWEACGTSGMKMLVNGGLNLSELDGWWAEAYSPEVGWALGSGEPPSDPAATDAVEANALYSLLEQQIVPEFYSRNASGIPVAWTERIRNSMASLAPHFSANRMLREYTNRFYLPAAIGYKQRIENNASIGSEIVRWQTAVQEKWHSLRFIESKTETQDAIHHFESHVYLDELGPNAVKLQLYAEPIGDEPPEIQEMAYVGPQAYETCSHIYRLTLPAKRPIADYTPRIVAHFPGASTPLEAAEILWQR